MECRQVNTKPNKDNKCQRPQWLQPLKLSFTSWIEQLIFPSDLLAVVSYDVVRFSAWRSFNLQGKVVTLFRCSRHLLCLFRVTLTTFPAKITTVYLCLSKLCLKHYRFNFWTRCIYTFCYLCMRICQNDVVLFSACRNWSKEKGWLMLVLTLSCYESYCRLLIIVYWHWVYL